MKLLIKLCLHIHKYVATKKSHTMIFLEVNIKLTYSATIILMHSNCLDVS